MDSNQVTRRQARIIHARVEEMRSYLFKLRKRMADNGFPPDDQLFQLVKNAELAIGELYVDLDVRRREGPIELPEAKRTPWLEQRSARKRDDRR